MKIRLDGWQRIGVVVSAHPALGWQTGYVWNNEVTKYWSKNNEHDIFLTLPSNVLIV